MPLLRRRSLALATLALLGPATLAASPAPCAPIPTPAWRIQTDATLRLGYEGNVFLQDRAPLAPGATTSAPARAHDLTSAAAADFVLTGPLQRAGLFSLGYRAEHTRFADYTSENHTDHRLRLGLTGQSAPWAWGVSAQALHVNGSAFGPTFARLGGGPAIGGEPVRARRDQTATKASARLTRSVAHGWVRVLGNEVYHDFHTDFRPGASPYVDRGELSAGLEAARELRPGFALVAGLRSGRQFQADRPQQPARNGTNDLLRLLVGVEGRPVALLALDLRVGPDFRHYTQATPAALGRHRTAPYGEFSATWTPTAADTFTATARYAQWLCSSGLGAYRDSSTELGWKHRLTPCLSTRVTARYATGDSRGENYPGTKPFHDAVNTFALGADYRLTPRLTLEATLAREQGSSFLPERPGRAYLRPTATLGLTASW
jgi:hypothetical protein